MDNNDIMELIEEFASKRFFQALAEAAYIASNPENRKQEDAAIQNMLEANRAVATARKAVRDALFTN